MGSSSKDIHVSSEAAEISHMELLSSIIPSEDGGRRTLLHSYHHSFKGFSALLTKDEATILSDHGEVVSVFPDQQFQLHTTRSWDFLDAGQNLRTGLPYETLGNDVIIGVVDTGIWPESPSFNDRGIGEIPKRWRGVCMEGSNFKKFNCNRKLIGARFYNMSHTSTEPNDTTTSSTSSEKSPRDNVGHGSHTSSIAAGASVSNASYYGLAKGRARGGFPSARLASYKACVRGGCTGSTILKAIHDCIMDGVDIISISVGINSILEADFLNDPIAIGAFHAEENGVMVVCSGGNDGPSPYTIVNSAPWIFTVAASNIDRDFESTIALGNGKSLKGTAINFSNMTNSKTYPLAYGGAVASRFTPTSEARNCRPGSLDFTKVAGKIIVCENEDPTISREIKKLVVEDAKAKGLIVMSDQKVISPFDSGAFPYAEIGMSAASELLNYINSTKKPVATILPATDVNKFRPAPVVAPFSSRGPGGITENILKPDIMAPGVAILAAISPNSEINGVVAGKKPSLFAIKSGTSMACPHVSGAMAFIKSKHNQWSTSMIKSALMTTATMFNNMGQPLTNSWEEIANPHETGAGEISPAKALDPGLVFETKTEDYLTFLCHYGYKEKKIRLISKKTNFKCPKDFGTQFISNVNYPSISIAKLSKSQNRTMKVTRVVTHVGIPNVTTYVSSVHAPPGLVVSVHPEKISFVEGKKESVFEVSFDGKDASKGYNFGVLSWFDGSHMVQIVFAVNIVK
ncbi:hypothetical protein Leryth_022195 [Lithospermum erythrorhizon]|nr:hypothetical protein Leryth_022195 [Lithospermum erythrorhizon]